MIFSYSSIFIFSIQLVLFSFTTIFVFIMQLLLFSYTSTAQSKLFRLSIYFIQFVLYNYTATVILFIKPELLQFNIRSYLMYTSLE